jgi:cation transporter-like permease
MTIAALGIDASGSSAGGAKRQHSKRGTGAGGADHRGLLPSSVDGIDGAAPDNMVGADPLLAPTFADYGKQSIFEIARSRTGWLVAFCAGLLLAALVVEQFEDVLERHVELSFFVPLIMGHGGNTGSQSVTTVIRALALRQVHAQRDAARVVLKEAGAGAMMGALLGIAILAFSFAWPGISPGVGAVVAVALPLVSLVANGLGALLTCTADRLRLDPAVTAVPFMTTLVDSLGLVIYFFLARAMLGIDVDGVGAGGPGGAKAAAGAAAAAAAAGGKAAAAAGRRLLMLASSAVVLAGRRAGGG